MALNYYDILLQAPLNEPGSLRYLRSAAKAIALGLNPGRTPGAYEDPLPHMERATARSPGLLKLRIFPPAYLAAVLLLIPFTLGLICHMRLGGEENGFALMDVRKQHEVAQKCVVILYLTGRRINLWLKD